MDIPLDINLIPQAEVQKQEEVRVTKFSTIITIFILFVTVGVTGYFLYTFSQLDTQNKGLSEQVTNLYAKINSQAKVEINARNLDKKYNSLTSIMDSRSYYSMLLTETKARKPDNLEIQGMDVKGGMATVTGKADTYIAISSFINNLLDKKFTTGNPKLQNLFTSVALNSVELASEDGRVKFLIVVNFDTTLLRP